MGFEVEFRFLEDIFKKMRLQMLVSDTEAAFARYDCIPGSFQRLHPVSPEIHRILYGMIRQGTLYKLTDNFLCSYMFLELPDAETRRVVSIGPYLTVQLTDEQMYEQAERAGVPPHRLLHVRNYYESLPVFTETGTLNALVEAFCEQIWGEFYSVVDINQEFAQGEAVVTGVSNAEETEEHELLSHAMKRMEMRYSFENELIQAVRHGQSQKAERLLSGFSHVSFERRHADPVRNIKNYMIIMNTLLRKAAESGGVHPVHLDKTSSSFAERIESLNSLAMVQSFMRSMIRSYCRLVKTQSMSGYSAPVRNAIIQIGEDLAGDLSLKALAERQNINSSYLSTLFKKETGSTVTEYVQKRRIETAIYLLSSTKLQIQTIAQHCGIPDMNYFSKVFRKHIGKSPKEFRSDLSGSITERTMR